MTVTGSLHVVIHDNDLLVKGRGMPFSFGLDQRHGQSCPLRIFQITVLRSLV
jgi:hypothetical protein